MSNSMMLPSMMLPSRTDITLQLARGLELLRRHRWAHAVVALSNALRLDPNEPKALEYRARCYMMLGQMNAALEDAEKLVEVDRRRNEEHAEKAAAALAAAARRRERGSGSAGNSRIPSPTPQQQQQNASGAEGQSVAAAAGGAALRAKFTAAARVVGMFGGGSSVIGSGDDEQQQQQDDSSSPSPTKRRADHDDKPKVRLSPEAERRLLSRTAASSERSRNLFQHAKAPSPALSDKKGATAGGSSNAAADQPLSSSLSPSYSVAGTSIEAAQTSSAVQHTTFYCGLLLRAQVLFAMGCFEDACRRFHEGARLRPDIGDFSTGVEECEHILLGAVHPWRKREKAELGSAALGQLRPGSRGGATEDYTSAFRPESPTSGRSSSSANRSGRSSPTKKPWRPKKPKLPVKDRELRQCMPEMADDYFFLRQLRQHPRIFSTALGPGISRVGDQDDVAFLRRKLKADREARVGQTMVGVKSSLQENNPPTARQRNNDPNATAHNKVGKNGDGGGGGGTNNTASDYHNYYYDDSSNNSSRHQQQQGNFTMPHSGQAELAALCANIAVDTAEAEERERQNAALLASIENAAARAASAKRGGGGGGGITKAGESSSKDKDGPVGGVAGGSSSNKGGASAAAVPTTSASSPKAHGMFGNNFQPGEDDDACKKRRDFHVRPPDTRSWGVQSARGRKRMKDNVDTTLKYLGTQYNFWAHRDERTSVPALDEPDLPPRFRPHDRKLDSFINPETVIRHYQSALVRSPSGRILSSALFSSSSVNDSASASSKRKSSAKRRSSCLRIPLREVSTANASTDDEWNKLQNSRDRRRRSTWVLSPSGQYKRVRGDSVFDLSTSGATSRRQSLNCFSEGESEYGGDNDDRRHRHEHHHRRHHHFHDRQKKSRSRSPTPRIPTDIHATTQHEEAGFVENMHEVFRMMADQHNTELTGASSSDSQLLWRRRGRNYRGPNADDNKHPKITSGDYQFIRNFSDDVSSCVLAVPSNDQSSSAPAPVFVSESLRNVHQDIQHALTRGAAEVVRDSASELLGDASSHQNAHQQQQQQRTKSASGQQQQQQHHHRGEDDLARIQRALFESGDEQYHGGGLGVSPPRAITLKWGEYDGMHMALDEDDRQFFDERAAGGGDVQKSSADKKSSSTASTQQQQQLLGKDSKTKKLLARQHARHQRARALLAQNLQKELGVELPYETIFRIPLLRREAGAGERSPSSPRPDSSQQQQHHHHQRDSPSVHGRDYATVSVKASPPAKSWSMKPGATMGETRQEEVTRMLAEKKKRDEEGENEQGGEGEGEDQYEIDEDGQRVKKKAVASAGKRKRRQRRDQQDGQTIEGEEAEDGEDEDYDSVEDEEDSKPPPLTLDQVRSQYSRATRQRLLQKQQQQASSLPAGRFGGSMRMGSKRMGSFRMGTGSRSHSAVGFSSDMGASSRAGSDVEDITDTDTESDEESEYGEDGEDMQGGGGAGGGGGKEGGSSEGEGIAEAISAAKALLDEHGKSKSAGAAPFTTKSDDKDPHSFSITTTARGGGSGESPAMKKLNATLRNISRLCALGDVPQAIAIAAALVKELELANISSPQNNNVSSSPTSPSSSSPHRRQQQQQQQYAVVSSLYQNNSDTHAAFQSLAAKLRCTLGGLYLEIGEGGAAVGELSRAVLLAKAAMQTEVYEQAVRLLGECYQTSGEDVADSFENSPSGGSGGTGGGTSSRTRKSRASSIVRA